MNTYRVALRATVEPCRVDYTATVRPAGKVDSRSAPLVGTGSPGDVDAIKRTQPSARSLALKVRYVPAPFDHERRVVPAPCSSRKVEVHLSRGHGSEAVHHCGQDLTFGAGVFASLNAVDLQVDYGSDPSLASFRSIQLGEMVAGVHAPLDDSRRCRLTKPAVGGQCTFFREH
jgi:hypothetical protein